MIHKYKFSCVSVWAQQMKNYCVIYLLAQRAESRWFLCRAPFPFSSTWLSCSGTRPATKRADEHQSTRCITSQIGSIQQIKLRAKEQNNLSTTAQSAIGDRNWLPPPRDIMANDTKEPTFSLPLCWFSNIFQKRNRPICDDLSEFPPITLWGKSGARN